MLGLGVTLQTTLPQAEPFIPIPTGFGWDAQRFPVRVMRGYDTNVQPRALVDPAIWTGAAIHVDGSMGDDGNTGLGAIDGDFSNAKRSIHAAFLAGNATAAPYRVLVAPGFLEESAFTKNGSREPDQPCAIMGWGGPVTYRAGPHTVTWSNAGATATADVSAVRRVFSTVSQTVRGLYSELEKAADLAACQTTPNSWFDDNGTIHVNTGGTPGPTDIALIRSFHGARFMSHTADLYLEDIHCEGGITGALHCDAAADRNVVGVNCSFRYSAPSNVNAPLDAVRVRRTNGLVAFFDCDASGAAKDGWSFHEDGYPGMHVLLQNCTASDNGAFAATSVNAFTIHDDVHAICVGGNFGWSRNGTEVHCIQASQSWFVDTQVTARDIDGDATAFKCSNTSQMWLQNTFADAAGSPVNEAIVANGGQVYTRDHLTISGVEITSGTGAISAF